MMVPMDAQSRKVALITGVGRAGGIAAAAARGLALSCDLMLTGHPQYDGARFANVDREKIDALVSELEGDGARVRYAAFDLADRSAPAELVARTVEELGRLDVLIAAHAHSSETPLGSLSAEEIDRHLVVNVRATLLLVEAFAQRFSGVDDAGRVVLFSSGQRLGPMPDELAYAASKGGIEALVISLAEALAPEGITVNAVNPGPTDTGWLTGEEYEGVRARFPSGRWGDPDDAARLVTWLAGPDSGWVTGQVIDSEGGFRR
jgi:3-oxoacyl-[acyl-carrier protein] reductase